MSSPDDLSLDNYWQLYQGCSWLQKEFETGWRVSIEVVACLEVLQSCPVIYHQIIKYSLKLKYHQIKMSSFELLLDESLKHAFVSNILKSITRYLQGVQKNVLIEQNLGLGLGGAWSCLVFFISHSWFWKTTNDGVRIVHSVYFDFLNLSEWHIRLDLG